MLLLTCFCLLWAVKSWEYWANNQKQMRKNSTAILCGGWLKTKMACFFKVSSTFITQIKHRWASNCAFASHLPFPKLCTTLENILAKTNVMKIWWGIWYMGREMANFPFTVKSIGWQLCSGDILTHTVSTNWFREMCSTGIPWYPWGGALKHPPADTGNHGYRNSYVIYPSPTPI